MFNIYKYFYSHGAWIYLIGLFDDINFGQLSAKLNSNLANRPEFPLGDNEGERA